MTGLVLANDTLRSPRSRAMIIAADESFGDAAWGIIDRCRSDLRERGVRQWNDAYPTREHVSTNIAQNELYVLLEGGECVAVVALEPRQEPGLSAVSWETAEPALAVHRLCVDPDAQGRGLGRELMDFAERYAACNGFASIRLTAYSEHPEALALYRGRGYREAGQVYFPGLDLPFVCFERQAGENHIESRK